MIRSSSLTLQFSTEKKLNTLDTVFNEYTRVVNLYVNEYSQSNADLNASKNILNRFHQESSNLNNIPPGSTKTNFIVFH